MMRNIIYIFAVLFIFSCENLPNKVTSFDPSVNSYLTLFREDHIVTFDYCPSNNLLYFLRGESLKTYNLTSHTSSSISLPHQPSSLTVNTTGTHAAIGYTTGVMIVDLILGIIEKDFSVTDEPENLYLTSNNLLLAKKSGAISITDLTDLKEEVFYLRDSEGNYTGGLRSFRFDSLRNCLYVILDYGSNYRLGVYKIINDFQVQYVTILNIKCSGDGRSFWLVDDGKSIITSGGGQLFEVGDTFTETPYFLINCWDFISAFAYSHIKNTVFINQDNNNSIWVFSLSTKKFITEIPLEDIPVPNRVDGKGSLREAHIRGLFMNENGTTLYILSNDSRFITPISGGVYAISSLDISAYEGF